MRFPILSCRGTAAKSVLSLFAQLHTSPSFSVTSVSVGVFKSHKHLPKPTKKNGMWDAFSVCFNMHHLNSVKKHTRSLTLYCGLFEIER